MAIDFEEEEEPKTTLATCSQHNLKYDPNFFWGCVLCRTSQKKRISGYLVVGIVFLIAAAVYYLRPVIYPNGNSQSAAVVSVGDSSRSDSDTPEKSAYACRLALSRQIEECIIKIDPSGENARMDREFCLDILTEANNKCKGNFTPQNYLNEPLYNVNELPLWSSIRDVIEQNQQKIEECMDGDSYRFATRVEVNPTTGKVQNTTLSLFGIDTSQRFCLYRFLETLTFPTGVGKPYTFVTRIDSKLLLQNRPKETDDRSAEFKKFVEEHRKAKLEAERRAEIMKQRDAFDRNFKNGMNPPAEQQ